MPEIVVGSLSLFLGWLCLDHVSRVRARHSTKHSPRSRFYGEKPLMIVPSALGVLFVLDGLALLALAASARLRVEEGLEDLVSLEMLLILAPVAAAATAFNRTAARSRARRGAAETGSRTPYLLERIPPRERGNPSIQRAGIVPRSAERLRVHVNHQRSISARRRP